MKTALILILTIPLLFAGCASMTCRTCKLKCEKKPAQFLSSKGDQPGWECPSCKAVYDRADIAKEKR